MAHLTHFGYLGTCSISVVLSIALELNLFSSQQLIAPTESYDDGDHNCSRNKEASASSCNNNIDVVVVKIVVVLLL